MHCLGGLWETISQVYHRKRQDKIYEKESA